MHQIKTSIRQIAPADLPTITPIGEAARPMTDAELLNMGMQRISGDYYSCIHQEERDDDTLQWSPKEGQALPGTVVSEGLLQERHDKLPAEVRAKVMRASVIRSKDARFPADDLASAALLGALAAAEAAVGPVRGGEPLIDVSDPHLIVVEAQRQLELPDSALERQTVTMGNVAAGDVIEAENLIPHSWAGEPKR